MEVWLVLGSFGKWIRWIVPTEQEQKVLCPQTLQLPSLDQEWASARIVCPEGIQSYVDTAGISRVAA